jgi:CHAT domain-containing protein
LTTLAAAAFLLASMSAAAQGTPPSPAALPPLVRDLLDAEPPARTRLLEERAPELGPDVAKGLLDAGAQRRRANDPEGALAAFDLAREVADRKGLLRDAGRARTQAAQMLSALGRHGDALLLVEEARALFVRIGDAEQETRTILNRGILWRFMGDLDASLAAYEEARRRAEALGEARLVVIALNNTAVLHLNRGDLRSSLAALEQAVALQQGPPDQLTLDLLTNLGTVHHMQGNLQLAAEYLERSLAAHDKSDLFGTIHERTNLANVYVSLGRPGEARDLLETAAAAAEKAGTWERVARARTALGRLLLHTRPKEAEAEAEKAVAAARESNTPDALIFALVLLADVERGRGRAEASLRAADEAVAAAERLGSESRLDAAATVQGLALAALGRDGEAAAAFERAIRAIETQRERVAGGETEREAFLETRTGPYQGLLELHARRGRTEPALAQAERARARTLVDVLGQGRSRLDALLGPGERERQRTLRETLARAGAEAQRERQAARADPKRLAAAEERLEDARREHEAFRAAAFVAHPEMRARSGQAAPWTLEQTRALLDDRTLIASYAVTEDNVYLFTLSRTGGLRLHHLAAGPRDLEARTREFRQGLAGRDLGVRALARTLCDALLGPARAELRRHSRLLIVPDGPLWELPFQALECSPGRYLLEERAVAYAPSLTALREMSRRTAPRTAPRSLLALANPALDETRRRQVAALHRDAALAPLPEAEEEARAVGRLYGARSAVYLGSEAREPRFKAHAGRYRLLHFAAHGILNDASPLYSHLVLAHPAPGEKDDGLLEAWEIMELDLDADLAVLSACETGRGRVSRGEGLIGLSWAFSVAGCPTTVVSQWKVDSRSTSRLMQEFHRRLAAGRPTADALRGAALAVKADPGNAHPFYWAGFIVMGLGW